MASSTQSLEQRRSAYAWKCAQNANEKYVPAAKAAPALIMSNGLMQTLAYFQVRNRDLAEHIYNWLATRKLVDESNFQSVMASLQKAPSERYMQATEESLAVLRWIRQLADVVKKQGGE